MTTTRKLGKRPTDLSRPVLRMGAHLKAAAFTAPTQINYAGKVNTWLLGQNDQFGTCGPTSVANYALLVTTVLGGAPLQYTDAEIFDLYRRSGNPEFDGTTKNPDGSYRGDNGVDMTVMLSELVKGGIGFGDRNVKAVAFGKINPHDPDQLWAAGALFGGVLWGADLDVAQDEQFASRKPWDYKLSAEWGGHAVLAAPRYSNVAGTVADRTGLVTWARLIDSTSAFITHQVSEAYVVIFPWHLGSKTFLEGVDLAGVAAEYKKLTGRDFPAPIPAPQPAPAPAPAPESTNAFPSADVDPWLDKTYSWTSAEKRAKAAIRTWLGQQ